MNQPASIVNAQGRRMYLRPDGMGYETSKARRQRRLAEAAATR